VSLITRALGSLLALAVLAGSILYQRNQQLARQLSTAQARVAVLDTTLTATRHSLNVYMARAAASNARASQQQKELTHALQANQDWRDSPVPDAVFDGLYKDRGAARNAPGNAAR